MKELIPMKHNNNPLVSLKWMAALSAVLYLIISPVQAYDQPWNGNREDITNPAPPPPPPCPSGNCQCPNNSNTSSPVYTADGALVWSDVDIKFPTTTQVELKRTYNSFDFRAGLFGRGWVTAQESNIARTYKAITEGNADGSPKVATEFGAIPIWLAAYGRRYKLEETATQCSTPDVFYFTFQKEADGKFKQVFEDSGDFSIYSDRGVLLESYSDVSGVTVYYEYDNQERLLRQFDSHGFVLNFMYDEQGFISQVSDQAGRVWGYIYDEYGRLTRVLDPDGNTKDYGYQLVDKVGYKQHLLISVDDNVNDPVLKVTWGSIAIGTGVSPLMRVTSYTESDGRNHEYSYTATTYNSQPAIRVVKTTKQVGGNAAIKTQTYIADANNYRILNIANNTDGLNNNFIYDDRGNLIEQVDERGNITRFEYNSAGRKIRILEQADTPDVREIAISYYGNTNRISEINEYGARGVHFTYDDDLRVLTRTEVDLSNSNSRVWKYTYHPNTTDNQGGVVIGKVASIDGPQLGTQDTTAFEYNSQGLLTKINYPLNQSISYAYNAIGQRIREVDINGVETEINYDSKGRIIESKSNNRSTFYSYNPQGLITKLVDEMGRLTEFTYNNQNQILKITYPSGDYLSVSYSYLSEYTEIIEAYSKSDNTLVSKKVSHVDPLTEQPLLGYLESTSKQVYQNQYNEFDDITQRVLYGEFLGESGITPSKYTYTYDQLGRLAQTTNGLNGSTQFAYDALGRLVEVDDPNSSITKYQYDPWGGVVRHESSDTGVTVYEYDSSGNRVSKVDANNLHTTYEYDSQNRFTMADYEGTNLDISLTYDEGQFGKGRLTSVSDGSGNTTLEYDDRGLILNSLSNVAGVQLLSGYEYDDSGQLVQITYPSGLSIRYNYDDFGRLEGVQDLTSNRVLLADLKWSGSKISSYQQGNGLVTEFSYDLTSRLLQKKNGTNDLFVNQLDNQGQLVSQNWIVKGVESSSEFQYDLAGHLLRDGNFLSDFDWLFSYDSIGNRLSRQSSDNNQHETYDYLQNSNRLTQINSLTIQHDDAGNTINDGIRLYQYNAMNRLEQLSNSALDVQARYSYNYQGQRVRKQLSGSQTLDIRYVYGFNGELLGEYDSNGTRIKEYIYYIDGGDPELVALIEKDGTIIYVLTDHVSAPRLATDQNQNIVWKWVSDGFGNGAPNEDVDGDGAKVVINHRFSGQYYDAESGLNYNHFRYYDPSLGRYITSDPIALDGGLNTYGYAYQNPYRFSDRSGLAVPAVIGACAANPVCAAAAAAAARAAAAAAARALARAAAAAAAAACAAGLGPCGTDPGECSRSRHRYLQNIVNNLCKPNPGNCRAGEKCSAMGDKMAKHTACANARRNINRECFNGGDRGHQIEYTNRRQQAATCNGLLATCCE